MATQTADKSDQLVDIIRLNQPITIGDLIEELGVTENAVRQRLTRLMDRGLVERIEIKASRGRPSHGYRLTEEGRKHGANNLDDLAKAMWAEIQQIEDEQLRSTMIAGIAKRLSDSYHERIDGEDADQRLRSIAQYFADRKIPIALDESESVPVLKVLSCPYPDLADKNEEICSMETELISQLTGQPVELCTCQRTGGECCSFEVIKHKSEDQAQTQHK